MSRRVSSSASFTRLSSSFDMAGPIPAPTAEIAKRSCLRTTTVIPGSPHRAALRADRWQRPGMTTVVTTCKTIENQQYSRLRPPLGGFIFFGNRFGAEAFLSVWMQMARVKQEQDLFESE